MSLQDAPTSTNPSLSDEQLAELHPALAGLVGKLEGIAARDPNQGTKEIASALVEYFRTPE